MMAGCFTGAALFCYISSASAVLMDQYHLSQQQFAYAFGFNAMGIIILSAMNKRLAHQFTVIQRLTLGGIIQVFGATVVLLTGLFNAVPLWMLMCGLFCTVSGIGLTGPNAMALAMSQQGARAGTASALMGSGQFACGLLGGMLLNVLVWSALFNMGLLMLLFTSMGLMVILKLSQQLNAQTTA